MRSEIRAGTFRAPGQPDPLPAVDRLTLSGLLDTYLKQYTEVEHPDSLHHEKGKAALIGRVELDLPTGERRPFGEWHVRDVTTAALDAFKAARRPVAPVGTNRHLSLLRAAFNWAIRVGLVETTPFKRGPVTLVRLTKETPRNRRLEPGEADLLLAACGDHLRAIVEAMLESGCRKGELLSLQWAQVRLGARPVLDLPAGKTKSGKARQVPISTRLAAILEMRRNGPDDKPHPPSAFVFGNEVGERTRSVRTAWAYACRRAGIDDLRMHDLRREAASRWLDGGVPLQVIRDWLGHSTIQITDTYLSATAASQHEQMARYERRLQEIANSSRTGDHTRAHEDDRPNTRPQEYTSGRH